MTDAGIPMGEGREQQARRMLRKQVGDGEKGVSITWGGNPDVTAHQAIKAMLAFADTPPPAAAGDRALAEAAARIIDPDAWHETLPTDGCGAYWIGRRNEARTKADALLKALRTPEPDSGGEEPE